MKSRSHHRVPVMDQPDNWVNESWTVDCICGVNFDDGEEMVDCDECGVWVHTRCSRYIKSEKSFSCDKCKNKSSGNEREETEVAQLLADLPTKTLRIDGNRNANVEPPPRRPIRLWTHKPMEERVHVQGVPGGDPSIFSGLSSVFTPELWKCTGHVPKKFNFKYREFPCWDEDEDEDECSNGRTEEDKGAGVLFSLSKDSNHAIATPVATTLVHAKGEVEAGGCERVSCSEDLKKSEPDNVKPDNVNVRSQIKDSGKDEASDRPLVFHSGKRMKEDSGTSNDQSIKKKVRLVHKERDLKRRSVDNSGTDSTPSSDANRSEFHVARGPKIIITDNKGARDSDADTLRSNPLSGDEDVLKNNFDKSSDNLAPIEKPQDSNAVDVSKQTFPTGTGLEEKGRHQVYKRTKDSSKTDTGVASMMKNDDLKIIPLKEEALDSGVNHVTEDNKRSLPISAEDAVQKSEPLGEKSYSPVLEGTCNENCPQRSSDQDVKVELNVATLARVESSTTSDVKAEVTKPLVPHVESSADTLNLKTDNTAMSSLKTRRDGTGTEPAGKGQTDPTERVPSNPLQTTRQVIGSERTISTKRSSSDVKVNMRVNNPHPSKVTSKNTMPLSGQRKVIDSRRLSESKSHSLKTGTSDSNSSMKKDKDGHETSDSNTRRDRGSHEMARRILKDHPKSSLGSVLKSLHPGKVAQTSEAKGTLSDSKYSTSGSSSKTPSAQNNGVTSGCGESASQLENKNVSHESSKISSPGLSLKGETSNHSNSNAAPLHPPAPSNSPAILSDEELALLLHQELNSSPRVPRVPRMRNAGSIPQLGSPTGTTTLIKRISSSGGRDQSVVTKRKGKESPKRGSHSFRDDDETKDTNTVSPDQKSNRSSRATDALPKREGDNVRKGSHTAKKSGIPLSPTIASSRPFSPSGANETKSGSSRHLRNPSNDDAGIAKVPGHQTLPGLLAEIMGEGKRMTYEELCNAVLPHWPHLRKHNGERYAYSTHSQAVLDCLRNRHEWAQLVDRGPKQTNGGRKRRKHDPDTPSSESADEEEYGKDTSAKEVESRHSESRREDIPKGKRNARKRRRLALRGRHIKDVRKRRKIESDDGDDDCSLSSSSEDSVSSDDEMQEDDTGGNGSEADTSSDEEETRS